ncbi:hypothetical protein [Streptomyces sp. NPDC101237]
MSGSRLASPVARRGDGHTTKRDALAVAAWAEPVVTEESAPAWYAESD